jgi:hypothetical protein
MAGTIMCPAVMVTDDTRRAGPGPADAAAGGPGPSRSLSVTSQTVDAQPEAGTDYSA